MLRLIATCNEYGISKPTLYKWIDEGLPVHYVGKIPFFDKVEIDSFIKQKNDITKRKNYIKNGIKPHF